MQNSSFKSGKPHGCHSTTSSKKGLFKLPRDKIKRSVKYVKSVRNKPREEIVMEIHLKLLYIDKDIYHQFFTVLANSRARPQITWCLNWCGSIGVG